MTRATLRILSTTDLHMQMSEHDYFLDYELPHGGMLQLASHIKDLRNEGIQSILCDNGDFLQGNLLAEVLVQDGTPKDHPMIAAFNHLNYDAVVLGNHEFDFGIDTLETHLAQIEAAVLSANIRKSPKKYLASPWIVIDRMMTCDDGIERPLHIGIIGFTPSQTVSWNSVQLTNKLFADDLLAAALTHIPGLRRAGAEIVIAMAHTGIGNDTHSYGMENAALPLARLRGIDALVLGHAHETFPNPASIIDGDHDHIKGTLHGTPTIMAGAHAEYVGVLDLDLKFKDGRWSVADHTSRLHANTPTDPACCPKLRAQTKDALSKASTTALARLNKPVVKLNRPFNSFFNIIGYDPAMRIIAQASVECVKAAVQETDFCDLPLLGAAAPFRAGGRGGPQNYLEIQGTQLTNRHVSAIVPFNNPLCVVVRRGWQLRHWLESLSLYFNQIIPGIEGQRLTNPNFPAYHFDVIDGLEYTFDLSVPIRTPHIHSDDPKMNRLTDLKYQGKNVRDDESFLITTSSYRALGGGNMGHVDAQDILLTTDLGLRDMLEAHLATQKSLTIDPKANWHFKPIPNTSVRFCSSPKAVNFAPQYNVVPTGTDCDGFAQFDLKL